MSRLFSIFSIGIKESDDILFKTYTIDYFKSDSLFNRMTKKEQKTYRDLLKLELDLIDKIIDGE